MQESHTKDQANHPDPESCVGDCKAFGEALTGPHAGQPLGSKSDPPGADAVMRGFVVPEKLPNDGGTLPPAEGVEERRPAEGNSRRLPRPGHFVRAFMH